MKSIELAAVVNNKSRRCLDFSNVTVKRKIIKSPAMQSLKFGCCFTLWQIPIIQLLLVDRTQKYFLI